MSANSTKLCPRVFFGLFVGVFLKIFMFSKYQEYYLNNYRHIKICREKEKSNYSLTNYKALRNSIIRLIRPPYEIDNINSIQGSVLLRNCEITMIPIVINGNELFYSCSYLSTYCSMSSRLPFQKPGLRRSISNLAARSAAVPMPVLLRRSLY